LIAAMAWFNDTGILHYHASLLADDERVERFRDAIHEVVRPGDVVVDIGSGTGLLAYFACQAGAARVYAIEEGPIATVGREIALINRFAGRVEFFNDSSHRVALPERADVLISETLWNFGLGEGLAGVMADARARLLKPGAPVIPAGVELHVAAVQSDRCYAMLHDRPPDRDGIDFSPIRLHQVNNVQMPHLDAGGYLAPPALLHVSDGAAPEPDFDATVTVTADQAGVLHGVLGWFLARLSPSVVLGNEPPSPESSWAHAFFPVQNPIGVAPGDEITMRVESADDGTIWRWRIAVRRGAATVAAYDQTSRASFPHSAGAPDAGTGPRTTREGEVVAWLLQAMDGRRSLAQLEAGVLERFGARYGQPGELAELVRRTAGTLGATAPAPAAGDAPA
jgi:hypothetical protein